jgi:hypothetical protein
MKTRFISLFYISTVSFFAGCSSLLIGGSKLDPTVVGSQTTILVQGAEIALHNNPSVLKEFRAAAVTAGNYLLQVSTGTVILPVASLQAQVKSVLLAKGISAQNAVSISKIATAEYNLIAKQYGFSDTMTIPPEARVSVVSPLLAAIGNALLAA